MICPYCGKENPETIDICDYCGAPLTIPEKEPIDAADALEPNYTVVDSPPVIDQPSTPIQPAQPARGIYGNKIWWLVGCFALVILFLCCGVGLLVVYRYVSSFAANPTVTQEMPVAVVINPTDPPAPNQNVIFFDDFSDPGSGWDIMDTSDYYSDYYSGTYRIIVNTSMSDSWANPDDNVFGDVRVEVDATKNAGPDDNDFGIICRYLGANEFYYAIISSDGYHAITKVTADSSEMLGSTEMQFSSAINQGAASNHIRFDCVGSTLTLYANGQLLEQQTDTQYTTGNAGLIAGTYDQSGTDILFDNFSVLQP